MSANSVGGVRVTKRLNSVNWANIFRNSTWDLMSWRMWYLLCLLAWRLRLRVGRELLTLLSAPFIISPQNSKSWHDGIQNPTLKRINTVVLHLLVAANILYSPLLLSLFILLGACVGSSARHHTLLSVFISCKISTTQHKQSRTQKRKNRKQKISH